MKRKKITTNPKDLTKDFDFLKEKQKEIKKYAKSKKVYTLKSSRGVIETTDPEKWEEYLKRQTQMGLWN